MAEYRYEYDASGNPPDESGAYDAETRKVITKNASRSMELDPVRATLGLTATQLHARVLRKRTAMGNSRAT